MSSAWDYKTKSKFRPAGFTKIFLRLKIVGLELKTNTSRCFLHPVSSIKILDSVLAIKDSNKKSCIV